MAKTDRFATEKKLLEVLGRVERSQSAYSALYVNVSKLKPKNRHPSFVKIIAKLFDDLVGATEGGLFVLDNSDFVILGKNISLTTVDNAMDKLRLGLAADPLLADHNSGFTKLYKFPDDLEDMKNVIAGLFMEDADEGLPIKYAIEAAQIDGVMKHLDNINVAEIVKHQSVIRLEGIDKAKLVFQEFFVAVKDLGQQYGGNIDLTANKWLFQYLTHTLDKKTISSFMCSDVTKLPNLIGLNLNLSSVFSDELSNLINNFLQPEQKVLVEVQMADVFNNLNLYFEAKEELHAKGNKILIDAMSTNMLKMLNVTRLQPDMIKIFWDPMMEFDINDAEIKDIITSFGAENVVLAKCKDEKALRWGIKNGIRNFQGPYIDVFEVALIRKLCPGGKTCSTEECLKRRRLISGAMRNQCPHKDFLDFILG